MKRLFWLTTAVACVASTGFAQTTGWKEALARDSQALHDAYLANHPGVVDPKNPGFKVALDQGLANARERAKGADTYGAYLWAMREYVASFNDGHVWYNESQGAPRIDARWPGFLTREQDGTEVVAARADDAEVPSLGAQLVSCDGVEAKSLAAQNVGHFRGRWDLASTREAHAWRLFVDAQNPYIKLPSSCIFDENGAKRAYSLQWKAIGAAAMQAQIQKVVAVRALPVGAHDFGDHGLWITASSFDGNAESSNGKALQGLTTALTKPRVTAAQVIVLDVRGNGGGSSSWGDKIGAAIWGEQNVEAAQPKSDAVEWRASDANIAAMRALGEAPGAGVARKVFFNHLADGMSNAKAAGQALWRQTAPLGGIFGGGNSKAKVDPAKFKTHAKVFVLTDAACASACLDALDVWKSLGAVQIGRETSADSLYMEVRSELLPSGMANFSIPMKVYRGRPRGMNQPYRPDVVLNDEMGSDTAIEARVRQLTAKS